jgi:hypothetical protein
MRRIVATGITSMAVLSGCMVTVPVAKVAPAPALKVNGGTSLTQAVTKTPDAGVKIATAVDLTKFAGTLLTGKVKLDASYIAGVGAGILSDNGAGIVTNNSSRLFIRVGAGILSDNGAGVLSYSGAGILSDAGGGLVSNNSGNLVSNNGSGLVSKVKWRLLQQATSPQAEFGTQVPVAGMSVAAVSLRTGKILNGLVVQTDTEGRYTLKVPADLQETFAIHGRVSQTVAGALVDDPRLRYTVIVPAKHTTENNIDEDTALVGRYVRLLTKSQMDFLLTDPSLSKDRQQAPTINDPQMDAATQTLLLGVLQDVAKALKDANLPAEKIPQMTQRLADSALAYIDLDAVKIDRQNTAWKDAPDATALQALVATLQQVREAARSKMLQDPSFFDHQDYFQQANADRKAAGLTPFTIRRPSDAVDFIAIQYVGGDGQTFRKMVPVLASLGLGENYTDGSNKIAVQLSAASKSLAIALGLVLVSNTDARKSFLQTIRSGI